MRRVGEDCLQRLEPVADDAVLALGDRGGARGPDSMRAMVMKNERRLAIRIVSGVVHERRDGDRHAAQRDEQREEREGASLADEPKHSRRA